MLAAVHDDSEEEIEHDRKANDGEGEAAGAHKAHEFVAGFAEEDGEAAREGIGGAEIHGRGRHGSLL